MDNKYRSILPASRTEEESATADAQSTTLTRKKRVQVAVACLPCRTRKVACDGQQPVCGRCASKTVKCTYRSTTNATKLKRKISGFQSELQEQAAFLQHLKTVPEDQAVELLRRLRSTDDPSAVLSAAKGGMHKRYRLSEKSTARALLPPAASELDFELMSRHQKMYPVLLPINVSTISLDTFWKVSQYTATIGMMEDIDDVTSELTTRFVQPPPTPLRSMRSTTYPPVPGPYPPRRYIDKRLENLHIGYWTRVPISDEYAASVISVYLQVDHPTFGWFDVDLFIDDLVEHRLNHCSPFMVSALLSYACQTYTILDVSAAALSQAFSIEAGMLWKTERSSESLVAAVAMQMHSACCVHQRRDKLAIEVARSGRHLAEKLKLFGVPESEETISRLEGMPDDIKKATSQAAWGIYNWLTFYTMFFDFEPIEFPPLFPIPGEITGTPSTYRGIPWPPHRLPAYMGDTFTQLSGLLTIAQEILLVYSSRGPNGLADKASLAFAESKYRRLLDWASQTPPSMLRSDESKPHVLIFHMIFHFIVMYIFRPFAEGPEAAELMRSFSSPDSSPKAIHQSSISQLKRLLLSRMNYPTEVPSVWHNVAIVTTCTAVLNSLDDPEWHFYFLLCMRYCEEMYVIEPIALDIMQGLLALAVQNGALSSTEAMKLSERARKKGMHHKIHEEKAAGNFTIDFSSAIKDPNQASAQALAEKFNELTMLDQFIKDEFIVP